MAMQRNQRSLKQILKNLNKHKIHSNKTSSTSSEGLFSKWLIVFICSMIIAYLIIDLICGMTIGQFLPDVLTTAWFAFWAVELINLVVIKKSKIRATQFSDSIESISKDNDIYIKSKDEFGNFDQFTNHLVSNDEHEMICDKIESNENRIDTKEETKNV